MNLEEKELFLEQTTNNLGKVAAEKTLEEKG
jgi:hypothetical protein